jgi:AraC family transcriptional activator FtrA
LLDGKRAATHWRHATALHQRFPAVEVDPDALLVVRTLRHGFGSPGAL